MTPSRGRGERAGLSREAVLDAGLALIDRNGLKALSMRALGADLGVEAMTLYHYVSNKEELLDGVVERVVAADVRWDPARTHWRDGLRAAALNLRRAILAHPNAIPVVVSRPSATRGNLIVVEAILESLCAAGFTPKRAVDVLYSVTGFVVGHCGSIVTAGRGPDLPRAAAPLDSRAFPRLTEAARLSRPGDDARRFEFALDAMLAGFDPSAG